MMAPVGIIYLVGTQDYMIKASFLSLFFFGETVFEFRASCL
jgi:hypothetical protein